MTGPLMTENPGVRSKRSLRRNCMARWCLDRLFPDGSVALMVLFSSTSTADRACGAGRLCGGE